VREGKLLSEWPCVEHPGCPTCEGESMGGVLRDLQAYDAYRITRLG